jgi:hypothetical protein
MTIQKAERANRLAEKINEYDDFLYELRNHRNSVSMSKAKKHKLLLYFKIHKHWNYDEMYIDGEVVDKILAIIEEDRLKLIKELEDM